MPLLIKTKCARRDYACIEEVYQYQLTLNIGSHYKDWRCVGERSNEVIMNKFVGLVSTFIGDKNVGYDKLAEDSSPVFSTPSGEGLHRLPSCALAGDTVLPCTGGSSLSVPLAARMMVWSK